MQLIKTHASFVLCHGDFHVRNIVYDEDTGSLDQYTTPNVKYTETECSPIKSKNKPLPEPMFTQISVAIWCHQATMS